MKKIIEKNTLSLFPLLFVSYEMATCLSNDAYLPALPAMMKDLSTTHYLAQLTLTAWFLGYALLQLFLGPIADRFGRRNTLLFGSVIAIIATMGCALSTSIHQLLFFRLLQGMMVGTMSIPGYATVHELYTPNEAIKKLAFMKGIFILAPAFGPLFGSAILTMASWRIIFAITAAGTILSAVGLFFIMPETCPIEKRHPLHLLNTLSGYKKIIFNRHFIMLTISACCLYGAMIAWITAGPFLIISTFHYGPFGFGIAQCFIFGAFIVGTKLTHRLLDQHGAKNIVKRTISIALISCFIALIASFLFPYSLSLLVVFMMIISTTAGICSPILNRKAIESSQEKMGLKVTLYGFMTAVFGSSASALISGFYNEKITSLISILFFLIVIAFTFAIISAQLGLLNEAKNDIR